MTQGRALRHFLISVAGVTYPNRDGSNRQTIIATCRAGESVILEAEPDNLHHENAVRVLRKDGSQIGYVVPRIAPQLPSNITGFTAFVAAVDRGGPYLKVSLLLVLNEGEDVATVESYARQLLHDRRDPLMRRARRMAWIPAVIIVVALVVWRWLGGS